MGHNMNEVKKGKIYKIIALTDNYDINDVYYGSTINKLSKRLVQHRADYKSHKEERRDFRTSFIIFDKYGIENCKIVLVEEFDFINKEDLLKRETEYILKNKCVNRIVAYKEIIEKPILIKYIPENKKKKIEEKKDYDKKYRDLNKEKYFEDNICECGGLYKTKHKIAHIKTNKHQQYIKEK